MNPPDLKADGKPALSVILVTDDLAPVRRTLRHLANQSIANRIEIVFVAPAQAQIDSASEELRPFWGSQVGEVQDIGPDPWAWGRAQGVRAARGDLVVFGETHAYPQDGWAEALLCAHQGPWAAVGPGMTNASQPPSAVGWASMLVEYGPFVEPDQGREADDLPGHNSSYKRALLTAYGSELGKLMQAEYFLHGDLRARGERLWLEPEARVAHLCATQARTWLVEPIATGRRFAAIRSASWSRPKRLAYALGAPLIPVVRLARIFPVWRRLRRRRGLPRLTLPLTALQLALSGVGELLGYAIGSGRSMETLAEIELHRERYLRAGESPPEPGR